MEPSFDKRLEQRTFRLITFAVLAGTLLLVWTSQATYERFARESARSELQRDLKHNLSVVEQQLLLALDNVAVRLSATVNAHVKAPATGLLTPPLTYGQLQAHAIRSLSRLDDAGLVAASTSAANLGVLVPKALTSPTLDASPGEMVLREVWPYPDIGGLAREAPREPGSVWLASAWFPGAGGPEHWVAAINPGYFEDLWSRSFDNFGLKIAVYDRTGQVLLSRLDTRAQARDIGARLANKAETGKDGMLEVNGDQSLLVAYRASQRHPLIVAVVGDRDQAIALHAPDVRRSTYAAIAASLALLIMIAVGYARYRRYESALVEAANEAMAVREHVMVSESQVDGTTIRVNDAFLRVSGFQREELVGRRNSIIDADWHPPAIQQNLWKTIRGGRIWTGTLRDRNKAGRDYWVNATIMPITDGSKRITRYMVLMSDLTQVIELDSRLQTERELRRELITSHQQQQRMEQQLRESQKLEAIGQLTGGLAHDFNNLLGIVVGNLDRMDERLPDDAAVRLQHRTALQAALRGAEVTRALLAVARRQPLKMQDQDMNELLRSMAPLLDSTAGSAITVQWDLLDGPLNARLDPGGLSNVVLNLVINARDAMQDSVGERTVTLRTRCEMVLDAPDLSASGRYAVLQVSDLGVGMSEAVRLQAFEPFFTTKERGQGTGLGLAMVYGYASQLGGTVRIRSEEHAGTTVSVYLPCQPEVLPDDDMPAPVPARAPTVLAAAIGHPVDPPAPSARVLVVDDEPELCALAGDWLEALGYSVATANSPARALELLREAPFDVLFTDVVMPGGMDGLELARKAIDMIPGLCVLLASGYAQSVLDATELPGSLLNKPYRKKDVASAMANALQGRHAGRSSDQGIVPITV